MVSTSPSMAEQVALAARTFQQQSTGFAPQSVNVVLCENTLVVTLHEALTPAEIALARSPEGAAQVQEFHRQPFTDSSEPLRQKIERITGVQVRESKAEIEINMGTVVQVFTTGTMVQVFLLSSPVSSTAWNSPVPDESQ